MKKMLTSEVTGSRFVGLYGIGECGGELIQMFTPTRDSIAAVVTDLTDKQKREGKLGFVQIVDLSIMEPVEPYRATLARLHATTSP